MISTHKKVERRIGHQAGLTSILPLQNLTTEQIKDDLIALNIKSKISVVNKKLPIHSILSQAYHLLDFAELKRLNIDLCGENGEFHTILYDAPFFTAPLAIVAKKTYCLNEVIFCEFKIENKEIENQFNV